jgi:hypothetical protein
MPLAYDEEHVQLRQLLRSLQATPLKSRAPLSDWVHDRFGTGWYKRVAEECSKVLRVTKDEVFTKELTALQTRCTTASLAKSTIRTPALEKDILRLWTPLAPHLETFLTQVNQDHENNTKGRGRLFDQHKYLRELLNSMAGFAVHANDLEEV